MLTSSVISRLLKSVEPLQRGRKPRVIVLSPTRELAVQIYDDFVATLDVNTVCRDVTRNIIIWVVA